MQQLSPAGQQLIADIAKRYGYGTDAVLSMLEAVINGNGRMAQFNHPEFGGAGQWMSGGMTMVSDMFNNHLKASVDKLCAELAQLAAAQPGLLAGGSFQSQVQGGQQQGSHAAGQEQGQRHPASGSGASLFIPPAPGSAAAWWGSDLGWPDSAGAQNGVRYAYFAPARRLAIDLNGRVTVYDTLDHRIGGFSQQQSHGGSISFTSQHGLVDVARLPVLAIDGVAQTAPSRTAASTPPAATVPTPAPAPAPSGTPPQQANPAPAAGADIFAMIDKLADLHSRHILTDAEFNAKKAELLARL